MAVLGTPSSSASNLIFFNATTCPEAKSFALYTTPYVPVIVWKNEWAYMTMGGAQKAYLRLYAIILHHCQRAWAHVAEVSMGPRTNFLNLLIAVTRKSSSTKNACQDWEVNLPIHFFLGVFYVVDKTKNKSNWQRTLLCITEGEKSKIENKCRIGATEQKATWKKHWQLSWLLCVCVV